MTGLSEQAEKWVTFIALGVGMALVAIALDKAMQWLERKDAEHQKKNQK
jgi:hypothetical protein